MADIRVTFIVQDADGDRRSVPYYFDGALTEANIQAFVTAHAPHLDAVVDGKVMEAFYQKPLTLPGGLKTPANANSEVQKGAVFAFDNLSRYKFSLFVPSWLPTLFTLDSPIVNAGAGQTYIADIVTGAGGQSPMNGLGFDLTALSSSRKAFRK